MLTEDKKEHLPPLHFNFSDSNEGMRSVERQLELIDLHIAEKIKTLNMEKHRLLNAEKSPKAIICYAFEMNSPTAIYVGDELITKFGDQGTVISVDKENNKFTILTDKKEEKSFTGCRLSYITEYEK